MVQIRILLAEDDINLGPILKSYLEQKGYACVLAKDGGAAVDVFTKYDFTLCILDITMPVKDGFETAIEIREIKKNIPIIFLTGHTQEEDKLKAFSLGADDYLTKPFSMDELLMRISAVTRRLRLGQGEESIFEFSNFVFDYNRQVITYTVPETGDKENMKHTSKESEILKIFCQAPNQVVDRSTILQKVWKNDTYFNARSMDVYITKLRKYLRRDPYVDIVNQHGVGFKLAFVPK